MSLDAGNEREAPAYHISTSFIDLIDEALEGIENDAEPLARVSMAMRRMLNANASSAVLYHPIVASSPERPANVSPDDTQPPAHTSGIERDMLSSHQAILVEDHPGAGNHRDTILLIPLVARDRLIGSVRVWSPATPGGFSSDDVARATICGRIAGSRVQRIRELRRMEALNNIGISLSSQRNLQDLYRETYEAARSVLHLDAFYLATYDQVDGSITFPFAASTIPDFVPGLLERSAEGPTSLVIHSGTTHYSRGPSAITADNASTSCAAQCFAGSSIHAPLRNENVVVGVIVAVSQQPDAYTPGDIAAFETIARQVSSAHENVLALALLNESAEYDRSSMTRLSEWQRALIRGSEAITHTGDVTRLIDTIASELERLLPHRSLAVYVVDEDPDKLTTIRVRDQAMPVDVTMKIGIGEGIVGAAVLDGVPLLVNDSHLDQRSVYPDGDPADRTQGEHLVAAPLIVSGGTVGAIAISREGYRPFTDDEFQAFTSFIPHFALVIHTSRLVARNRATYTSAIRALTATIDAKDPLTRGHSDRVARYARQIAAEMMLPIEEQDAIELAAQLHDIGKIGVPDDILSKPGPLSASERAIMMQHAVMGADILRGANSHEIARLIPLVRHHHEWYQGGGYPDGISGDDIPLGAAIIAVADAFDTMTTRRPYRDAMPVSAALDEARRYASTQFHPLAVDALTSTIETSSLSVDTSSAFNASQSTVTHITPIDVRPVSVLYRIAREIASIGNVDDFLQKVVRIIAEELRYSSVGILLPDERGSCLIIRADVWEQGSESLSGHIVPLDGSICGWVYQTGQVANVGDTHADPRFYPPHVTSVRSELAAPLTVEGAPIGVLNAESQHPHAFSGVDERLIVAIASQLAPAVQLAQVHDNVKRAAERDGLTGIYNHASFYSQLEEYLAEGHRIALFIFDVEGLKRINDTAGHLAGDSALRRVAAALDLETRPQDTVARYGGDEFAVIVTDVDESTALEMAARLQSAIKRLTWGSNSESMSISVGVAISGRDGNKATDLVEIADRRMYDERARARSGDSTHVNRRVSRSNRTKRN